MYCLGVGSLLEDVCQTLHGLLLLSRFSRVRLCATPQMAAHQPSPSLGFSRQEHWSGLPFPSPVHESEKWKWSRSVVSYSSRPHGLQPTRPLHPWDFPGKSTGVGCHHLPLSLTSIIIVARSMSYRVSCNRYHLGLVSSVEKERATHSSIFT